MPPLAFVGDVHGDSERLSRALLAAGNHADTVVLLGDYVNRGPDTRGVLALLKESKESMGRRLVLLRGNHDQALLEFLVSGNASDFLAIGGLTTIRTYLDSRNPPKEMLAEFASTFPASHRELLLGTSLCCETDDVLASHCGFDPQNPDRRGVDEMVKGSFPEIFRSSSRSPRPTVIVGHYVQTSGRPFVSSGLIGLDTGCGTMPDLPLTLVYWPGRDFVRID